MRKHPIVEFIKFIILIFVCCTTENPVVIGAFFIVSVIISHGKHWFSSLWVFFSIWVIDTFTISEGVTFLGYRNFHLVTLEGVVFGFLMGLRMVALWNLAFTMSKDLTTDKIVVITSYLSPSLSILVSMTIRAVRRYSVKYKEIYYFRKSMEKSDAFHRLYAAVTALSVLLDWALENGMETSQSMQSRKYGTVRRTSYTNIRINGRDIAEIVAIFVIFIIYEVSKPTVYILPAIELHYSAVNCAMVLIMCIYAFTEEYYEDRTKRDFV